jgi:quinol-cytochrome oxidoreductase complex cytochrome b subunit
MTEIPEHLLKRAQAAREKAAAKDEGGDASATEASPAAGGTAVATAERTAVATAVAAAAPLATGPAGHTQRLLTVVKAGSIQDVRATPVDKVHTWPHLLLAEFVAALFITAFLLIFSIFVNAPLLTLANFNLTPNPSKAPWYFLGLQELLTMFHPMVAGVTIPGMGLFVLILAPYIDKNPSNRPEDRKFAISLMTVHLMFWAVLVMIGSFFRGPGQNFVFPWTSGLFFEL